MKLRPYQVDGIQRVREASLNGFRAVLMVLATGGGKTICAAEIIRSAHASGSRVCFTAHRKELIDQSYRKLVLSGIPESDVGVIMANDARRRPTAPIQVASIQTLINRPTGDFDIVFIDEAHRSLAKSYVDLKERFPRALFIGLTATPYRAEGRGLGEFYDHLVVVASPSILIREGYLVEPTIWSVPRSQLPDLSEVKMKGNDYDEASLAAAVNKTGLVGDIVDHWLRRAEGKRTVVFAAGVEHSKSIAERFVNAGVAAEHLDGETPIPEREAILARLDRGETRVVANMGVLCEGWDMPSVKCCILARPTKSTGLYLQMAGRTLRPWNDEAAIILDHAGNAIEHGFPQDDREFSLEAKKKNPSAKAPGKACETCYAIVPAAAKECPQCGTEFPAPEAPPESKLEEKDGELVRLVPKTNDEKKTRWAVICEECTLRGFKPGWASFRYKEEFGTWPPFAFPDDHVYTPEEKAAYYADLVAKFPENPKRAMAQYKTKFGEWPARNTTKFVSFAAPKVAHPEPPPVRELEPDELEAWML